MIKVKMKKSKNKVIFQASGHAMQAPKGQDIVCAAFSTLWQHTAYNCGGVEEYQDGRIDRLTIPLGAENNIALCRAFHRSVEVLATQYPDNLEFDYEQE